MIQDFALRVLIENQVRTEKCIMQELRYAEPNWNHIHVYVNYLSDIDDAINIICGIE